MRRDSGYHNPNFVDPWRGDHHQAKQHKIKTIDSKWLKLFKKSAEMRYIRENMRFHEMTFEHLAEYFEAFIIQKPLPLIPA